MFLGAREVVCRLQATVRRNQVRKRFARARHAVVTIQQWYRAQVTMKKIYEEYHCLRHAAIVIQSHFRRHCQRQAYLRVRQMVVVVQSMVRMRLNRTKFLRKRSATVVIQGRYRAYMFGKAVRQRCKLMQWAATRIQVSSLPVIKSKTCTKELLGLVLLAPDFVFNRTIILVLRRYDHRLGPVNEFDFCIWHFHSYSPNAQKLALDGCNKTTLVQSSGF